MMQNPLFPSTASNDVPADAPTPSLPDYLQTGAVQGTPGTPVQPAALQPSPIVKPEPFGQPQPAVPHPGAVAITQPATPMPSSVDLTLDRPNRPTSPPEKFDDPNRNAAADIIRQKLNAIYGTEPDAHAELERIEAVGPAAEFSKHQQYMQMLNESGKPWTEVQNDWHNYYMELPDDEKHQVWQEFYQSGTQQVHMPGPQPSHQSYDNLPAAQPIMPDVQVPTPTHIATPQLPSWQSAPQQPQISPQLSLGEPGAGANMSPVVAAGNEPMQGASPGSRFLPDSRASALASVSDIKQRVLNKVNSAGSSESRAKQHLKSLAFGVMTGTAAVLFFLLLFFNEVVIAPFIQPSRTATETPIIVDTASAAVGKEPKVIIPKINVEIPVDYTQTTTDEAQLQKALDNGVIHYPTTVRPGQEGNAAFFGHSSNNILNPGKYKFAFLLLHKLTTGDTFYLTFDGKAYAYEVISMRVVEPTEIGVLGPVPNEKSTATLITCDPPGTSLKRLVVVGRQTSPDPSGNTAPTAPQNTPIQTASATEIPGNGPTLWSRMWDSIF